MRAREVTALDRAAATRVRVLAGMRGMRQVDIAVATGIPTSTLGRYWNAETAMTLGDLERILAVLGTSHAAEAEHIDALIAAGGN